MKRLDELHNFNTFNLWNELYVFYIHTAYETVGCYKDKGDRAIPILEGKDPILDGGYQQRINAIDKCYRAARKRGFKVFSVQHGGQCFSSSTAQKTFNKHGVSSACNFDGEGAAWNNQVYFIKGERKTIRKA